MPQPVTLQSFLTNMFAFLGAPGTSAYAHVEQLFASLWLWIIIVAYALSIGGIAVIAWSITRLFELRRREEEFYGTLLITPEVEQGRSPRWERIEELAGSANPSAWREAILEADIMLDDMLARQGYAGEGVGEKLRQVERSDMNTLNDAWEAHRVRNQVAHEGSAFDLSQTLTQRTIARYEAVFREFGVI